MASIIKVIGWKNKKDYALVHVLLNDGTEAVVYVGGSVEVYFAHNRITAFVKKTGDKPVDNDNNVMVESGGKKG